MLNTKILEAATGLFLHNGLKSVSMDDIAQSVGISKRTLYENFTSKDELVSKCLIYREERNNEYYVKIVENCQNFVEIITRVMLDILREFHETSPLFYQDLTRYHFRTANAIFSKNEEYRREGFERLLQRGISEGLVKPDINIQLTIDLIMNNGSSMKNHALLTKYSFSDIFSNIFIMVFRGISTPLGIEKIDYFVEEELKKITL